jgi:hypothetical protein
MNYGLAEVSKTIASRLGLDGKDLGLVSISGADVSGLVSVSGSNVSVSRF